MKERGCSAPIGAVFRLECYYLCRRESGIMDQPSSFILSNASCRPTSFILVYPYANSTDDQMNKFINGWNMLDKSDGAIAALYEHWSLGRGAGSRKRWWSLLERVSPWLD